MPESTVDANSLPLFEATYATPMDCESCIDSIKTNLHDTSKSADYKIDDLKFDQNANLFYLKSNIPPSMVLETVTKNLGKDVVLRGTGGGGDGAVSILEAFTEKYSACATAGRGASNNPTEFQEMKKRFIGVNENSVKGLVRMVSLDTSNNTSNTYFDITVNGVDRPGLYYSSIHANGDISNGCLSTGPILHKLDHPIKVVTPINVSNDKKLYKGSAFFGVPNMNVGDLIGRSFVITNNPNHEIGKSGDSVNICGVIARSAGIWENDKQVCACSGKTIWEERKDAIKKNIDNY
ncbi:related to Superoxide dismutase 1 copper chaperone [Saccharomycodes ludwigii]|uniref:Related to Superoxide dismutase 1 copper chaperone n=1 Tax=Saccharomycodes ludwigii TaxID=36035 RepID=A0A376B699_9ASCO|nr:hypothetical protein SCDLUD_004145 [Saccharomycodes ludwigii]KAH3899847.1 hypothetical protein SCDLUD_004145 [Saccharomycodes ludwigii]SSD60213.1 related to Superoxide dismutase 1 copper chaperone [Saccharomycodes ludwigii]